jgi:hypothetical protein
MDELLAQRDKLNAAIQQVLDLNTAAWGMKVTNVEIKDIDLDETMIRAMARQAVWLSSLQISQPFGGCTPLALMVRGPEGLAVVADFLETK